MIVSEDGSVTGSIDVSKLDEVEPKSDEARAQIEQLKAEAKASQEQAVADAERLAQLHETQSVQGQARDAVTTQGDQWGDPNLAANTAANPGTKTADQSGVKAADQTGQTDQETKQLQTEAEAAGVTVDKRWGADRLRQEIDQAKAQSAQQARKQR
jgi:hypothetical protein